MPITKTITLYQFDELSDAAKEKARDWYRQAGQGDVWWDSVYEDADRMAALLGIELDRKGKNTPAIYFSGFSSQGDGACFEGSYSYKKGALKAVQKEAPAEYKQADGKVRHSESNVELHRIAKGLQDVQRRHFYQLEATCTHRGHYHHSGCMWVDVGYTGDDDRDICDADEDITQLLRDFADWIYQRLQDEDEYLNSDEVVDENIRINEYTFTEEGERED